MKHLQQVNHRDGKEISDCQGLEMGDIGDLTRQRLGLTVNLAKCLLHRDNMISFFVN